MSELPRHRWIFHQCAAPGDKAKYDLWLWFCPDCMKSTGISADPDLPRPPDGPCPGPGPHDAGSIALLKYVCDFFGHALPERFREG